MAKKPEDVKLDSIMDSLFIFLPLFYRKIFQVAHTKAGVNPGNMQFHVLAMIMKLGTLQTSDISCRLGISKSNTTSLLDKLIEKGYAQRELDSNDKRIKNIVITEKGRRFVTGRKKIMRNEIKRSLSTLDMNDLLTLSGALEAFTDIVSKVNYGS
ncbi:MAG: MarR family transcriptional regulator [Dehalococcoidia bacterium]|jgi:DNA-binding MarR family transcriptional regulator